MPKNVVIITKDSVKRLCELFLKGFTYREIAEDLEIPIRSVTNILQELRDLGADLPLRNERVVRNARSAAHEYLKDLKAGGKKC